MKTRILLVLLCLSLCGCTPVSLEADNLSIVTTLFPQYDFAREICKDRASISLLLPPGMDSHSYAPTPQDALKTADADLFIYTGAAMEPWSAQLTANTSGTVLDASVGIPLLDGGHIHASSAHGHAEADTVPHIWTNPQNAIKMTENICQAVCALDPENAAFYRQNADLYIEKLSALDVEIEKTVMAAPRKKIVFGGHFAMRYFTNRYHLSYLAAFDACSGEAEPSPAVLSGIIEEMKNEGVPAVYFEELSTPRTAELIAEETGAKALLLHSCHNLSKAEQNETYLSLMYQNLENLKIGLGYK